MMPAHRLVDSHVHLWDPKARDHRWLQNEPALDRAFLPQDFPVAAAGSEAWVFVQADCAPDQNIDEVEWVLGLATDGAPVIGIVAGVQLENSHTRQDVLNELARHPSVTGVRRLLQDEEAGFALTRDHLDGVGAAGQHGFVVDLCVRHTQIPEITEMVFDHRDVEFVLDHLGKPPVGEGWSSRWASDLARLATAPNVRCKLSGLTSEAPAGTGAAVFVPWLRHALDVFGADRCLFGGDWPVSTLTTTYEAWVDIVLRALHEHGASDADSRAVLETNAIRCYSSDSRFARAGGSC